MIKKILKNKSRNVRKNDRTAVHGVALSLNNTAQRGDLVLDEYLATVMSIRDGKISAIDTYLSEVNMVNAFFVPQ